MTSAQGQSCECPTYRVCCYSPSTPQSFFRSWFRSVRETWSLFFLCHWRLAPSLSREIAIQDLLLTFCTNHKDLLVKLWRLSIAAQLQPCAPSRIFDREVQHKAFSLCHLWALLKTKITRRLSSMRQQPLQLQWSSKAHQTDADHKKKLPVLLMVTNCSSFMQVLFHAFSYNETVLFFQSHPRMW